MIFRIATPMNFLPTNRSGSVILALVLLTAFPALSQRKYLAFYKDTVFKYKDYTIYASDTYVRKPLFLRSAIVIDNPTSSYLILDYTQAFITGADGVRKRFHNDEDAVFRPKGFYRQRLRFDPTPLEGNVTFHFPKAFVTDKIVSTYEPVEIAKFVRSFTRVGNISIEVLKMVPYDTEYKIRVRIIYTGIEFLAINFENISATGEQSGKVFNRVRPNHRMHHRQGGYLEMATLTFPRKQGERIEKMLLFENVFTEYSLKEIEGFNLNYTVYPDEKANRTKKELKEQEKEQQ